MMRRLEFAGIAVVASIVAAMAAPVWKAEDGVIFEPARAATLLHQCSRDTPQHVTGFWLPQTEQIADLEMRLPTLVDQEVHRIIGTSAQKKDPPMPNYLRQYAGLIKGGRKIIYVNGFLADEAHVGDGLRRKTDWRTRAVMVCDGYINYFGVEYDPQSKVFMGLAFNGAA